MSNEKIIQALEILGLDPEMSESKAIAKLIKGYIPSETELYRKSLLENTNEFYNKLFCNDLFTREDINKHIKSVKDCFPYAKTNMMIQTDLEINKDIPVTRFVLPSFPTLQKATWGLKEGMYLIGADSHVGKTAMLIQLACDVLSANKNAVVYFFSLDDRIKKFKERLISCQSFLECGHVDEAVTSDFALSRYTHIDAMNRPQKDPRIIRSRDKAVETIKDYIGMKRLNIFDGRFDNNKLEQAVENVDQNNAIILIDAVYRVKVSGKDKVEREEELVMWVKDLSNNFLVPVVSVKEMKKGEGKGANVDKTTGNRKRSGYSGEDMRGSILWDYEPDVEIILSQGDDSDIPFTNNVKMKIDKNKIRGMQSLANLQLIWNKTIYRELI